MMISVVLVDWLTLRIRSRTGIVLSCITRVSLAHLLVETKENQAVYLASVLADLCTEHGLMSHSDFYLLIGTVASLDPGGTGQSVTVDAIRCDLATVRARMYLDALWPLRALDVCSRLLRITLPYGRRGAVSRVMLEALLRRGWAADGVNALRHLLSNGVLSLPIVQETATMDPIQASLAGVDGMGGLGGFDMGGGGEMAIVVTDAGTSGDGRGDDNSGLGHRDRGDMDASGCVR